MMILGIVNDEISGACLLEDGRILAAASEERFTRIKNHKTWPSRSIAYVLETRGIQLDEVDTIAYGWSADFNSEKHLLMFFDRVVHEAQHNPESLSIFRERVESEIRTDAKVRAEFCDFLKQHDMEHKGVFVDHHECHALSAFVCCPYEDALVLTADGRGDYQAFTITEYSSAGERVLYHGSSIDSLGHFYGRITALLGFKVNRHEGKITGLAARGNPKKLLPLMEKMISYENGQLIAHIGPYYRPWSFGAHFSEELKELIARETREDVAAAAQRHLENMTCQLTEHYLAQTASRNLGLAGGVFANVTLNKRLRDIPGIENVFVQPHMTDGGLALGAAVGAWYRATGKKVPMDTMFLGPAYSEDEIEEALVREEGLQIERATDIVEQTVEAIMRDEVVGWFQGRMEYGPRALGHRSVLYHCRDVAVNDWLNERMERTEFMPFAPITAVELGDRCFLNWKREDIASYYMTMTYDCTEEMNEKCPAAVHVDGTARPQIVSVDTDETLHRLLLHWHDRTDGLALINTSFNMHEEPIVCSPSDAVNALRRGMIDVLVIGPYLVRNTQET